MSYTLSYHHIVIRTKYSEPTIPNENSEKLYRYIWGFVNAKKCKLFRINGMPDHIHLFVELHPTQCISEFIKVLKNMTHKWIKEHHQDFPNFVSWGRKYFSISYSYRDKDMIVNYIANQQEHHKTEDTETELLRILQENNIKIDMRYWNEEE